MSRRVVTVLEPGGQPAPRLDDQDAPERHEETEPELLD